MLKFRDQDHQLEYERLLEQMELGERELQEPTALLKKQLAFIYLIAMYQRDYELYEGMRFSIEVYEELEIDGPVYLLEDGVGLSKYPHERLLKSAKGILKGEVIDLEKVDKEHLVFIKEALAFVS